MRVLVTGRNGQVARALAERAARRKDIELLFAGRPEFDLADEARIATAVDRARPDLIVNAAAYTAVDKAEDEPEAAEAINARGPALLARAARAAGARLIQLSTDYVFDGSASEPYREDAQIRPLGVYGRTKAAGEEAVRAECPDHLIVRTSWVYSPFGSNFVKTMLNLAKSRAALTVVEDQIGNPSSALDLADGLLAAIGTWSADPARGTGETVHLAGTGSTSWADFARHIFSTSAAAGGPSAAVTGIPSSAWPTRATRPLNSRLDSSRFEALFGYRAPDWQRSSAATVRRLLEERQ